jgi:ABC-type polysaccharide/polyol phosphate export permease
VVVLIAASVLRGAVLQTSLSGVAWFVGEGFLLAIAMYGLAEAVANRLPSVEEYVGAVPALAIVPFFFAGALFPIGAMPGALTAIAKVLPLTHALALMRYGLVDPSGPGLHDIWGAGSTTAQAWASLGVVAVFAAALLAISIRVFKRAAVK